MIHKKLLSLLVLLMTAASGAWAEEVTVTFTPDDLNGTSTVTKDGVTITPGNGDARSGANFYHLGSNTFSVDKGTFTKIEIVDCNYVYPDIISGWQKEVTGSYQPYPDDDPWPIYTLTWTGEAESVTFTAAIYGIQSIVFTIDKPAEPDIEVTTNDTKTEATFDMPQYDVTATYTIKRDMTVDMTTKVGDGTDGVRFRIKKNAQSKYELVEEGANQPEVMDEIDAQNPTEVPATGYTLQLQKLTDDGETWENVSDYSVGTFRYVVTGQGDYDGIVYTNTFELFEGYVVKIPANEYITFFQKEMLYVEDEDVKIYTIVSVSDDEATATATEISVAKAEMPMLVKNNSAEDKNVLLIPTTDKSPDAVFVYNGFKGTLEATQIAASDDTQNNYAFNGMQFVWVKNAIDIDANKAWLEVPASNTAQARALTIVFSSETTGVELAPAFTTEGEGEWYDLNGRKLGKKPTVKGVYILRQADGKNTKKVAVE